MEKIVHVMLCGPVNDSWNYQDNMLTKYHKKMGYEVTMITSQWIWDECGKLKKTSKTRYVNADGVNVIRLPILHNDDFGRKLKRYKGLYETIEFEKPNILFVHGISALDNTNIAKYCKKHPNVVMYVDSHTDFSNSATNILSRYILHGVIWRSVAQVLNPYTKKFYGVLPARVDFLTQIYHLPIDKCELLVMGADDDRVEEASQSQIRKNIREKYGIRDDEFLIMTGGKIDEWKTQTLLLMEAVKQINDNKIKLIVFGSIADKLKEKVEALVDGKKIQYIGWINAVDSYSYFSAADLVVFPGRHSVFWEQVVGQGIPMLCKYWEGTTHVDIGGNVDFLYEDSVDEIKCKIVGIVENTEHYNQMRAVAIQKGMEVFSYKLISERAIK